MIASGTGFGNWIGDRVYKNTMTLIITELSNAGIVMAADSAITQVNSKTGQILNVDKKGWAKIVRVPSITAALSYWGMIGAVTQKQFDLWLKEKIDNSVQYEDLESFVNYLTDELNIACHGRILDESVGIHVSGYAAWSDGIVRPTFFHIHNGHGYIGTIPQVNTNGDIIALHNRWTRISKTIFEKHLDFPNPVRPLTDNLQFLNQGYHTRNGDFYNYLVIWEKLEEAFQHINLIPNFSVPADTNNLGSRKDYFQMLVETVIRIYECSNHKQKPSIGGTAVSLGIGPKGYLKPIASGIG